MVSSRRSDKCVDDRDPHSVETAGNLVRVVVELAAGVQHRHDDLGGRTSLLFVVVDRDSAPVVRDRDRTRPREPITATSVQYPASASSMELSTVSNTI